MSTDSIEEIFFCPHTFEVFSRIPHKDRGTFFSDKFDTVFYLAIKTLLSCRFDCYELVVKNYRSMIACFIRYFSEKELFFGKIKFGEKCVVKRKNSFWLLW